MSSFLSATSLNITNRAICTHHNKLSQLCLYSQGLRCRQGLSQRFSATAAGFGTSRQLFHQPRPLITPIPKFAANIVTASSRDSAAAASPQNFIWGETGGDLLVEALEREGVTAVFGNSPCFFLTAALERSKAIRTSIQTFPDEKNAFAAANSYTRLISTGVPAVCCVNSSWGYNSMFKESTLSNTPVVTVIMSDYQPRIPSAKCICGVTEVQDIPRVVKQAFSLATSGPRPGPIVISIPSEVVMPTRDDQRLLYSKLKPIVETILDSKRPILYMEEGCLRRSNKEVKRFVELTGGVPLASYNSNRSIASHLRLDYHRDLSSFQMLGVDCVENAVRESDLLLAFGARSDDALTGQIIKANKKDVVHIFEDELPPCDIENQRKKDDDSDNESEDEWHDEPKLHKHVQVHVDVKLALQVMNDILEIEKCALQNCVDLSEWREELFKRVSFIEKEKAIQPHHVAQMLHELTDGEAIISISGVKDQETWATKFYEYLRVKPTECEDNALAAAIGALVARPNAIVVGILGDGWEADWTIEQDFELIKQRNLSLKSIFLDYKVGSPSDWTKLEKYELPGNRVTKKEELRTAMKKMLDTRGPYLLQVVVLPKAEVSI